LSVLPAKSPTVVLIWAMPAFKEVEG